MIRFFLLVMLFYVTSMYPQERAAIFSFNGKPSKLIFNDSASLYIFKKIGYLSEYKPVKLEFSTDDVSSLHISAVDSAGSQVYRNFKINKVFTRFSSNQKLIKPYIVIDTWEEIEWVLIDKTKKVGGFICHKAIGDYRGRRYTAWFTREVQLPYGPWKLFGLPGLILEAHDEQKLFHFKFNGFTDIIAEPLKPPVANLTRNLREHVSFIDSLGYHLFNGMQAEIDSIMAARFDKKESPIQFRYMPTKSPLERRQIWRERAFPWEPNSPYRRTDPIIVSPIKK